MCDLWIILAIGIKKHFKNNIKVITSVFEFNSLFALFHGINFNSFNSKFYTVNI